LLKGRVKQGTERGGVSGKSSRSKRGKRQGELAGTNLRVTMKVSPKQVGEKRRDG